MNKKTKALAAGVAGVAVLAASGATFALWTDTAELGNDILGTGHLEIEVDRLTWFDVSDWVVFPRVADGERAVMTPRGDQVIPWSPTEDLLVPGDVVRADLTGVEVSALGANLAWELTFEGLDGETQAIEHISITEENCDVTGDVTGFTVTVALSEDLDMDAAEAVSIAGAVVRVTQDRPGA